jgi:hypothetical protein
MVAYAHAAQFPEATERVVLRPSASVRLSTIELPP